MSSSFTKCIFQLLEIMVEANLYPKYYPFPQSVKNPPSLVTMTTGRTECLCCVVYEKTHLYVKHHLGWISATLRKNTVIIL